jgi:hypothetical protein
MGNTLGRTCLPRRVLVVYMFTIAVQRESQGHRTPHNRIAAARGRIEIPNCRDTTCNCHRVDRAVPGACLVAYFFAMTIQINTPEHTKLNSTDLTEP